MNIFILSSTQGANSS